MRLLSPLLRRWKRDDKGSTAVEYGLIAALVVLAVIGGMTSVASANDDVYSTIENNLVGL